LPPATATPRGRNGTFSSPARLAPSLAAKMEIIANQGINVMHTFTAVVERCPETGLYVGFIPGFAGAHSQGEKKLLKCY